MQDRNGVTKVHNSVLISFSFERENCRDRFPSRFQHLRLSRVTQAQQNKATLDRLAPGRRQECLHHESSLARLVPDTSANINETVNHSG